MALWGSLQVKFGLSYIAVIAAVLLLLNTYPLLVSEDLVFRSKETNMTGSVSVVVYSLAGLNRLNQENVAAAMAVVEETGLSRVLVTDSAGLVLYDTRETGSAVGKYTFYSEIVQALEGYDAFSCSYRDGAFRSRTASPVLYQNRIIGAVYAYEYDTEQAALLEGLQSNLLKLSAGIAAAVVLLSILLSRMLTRKISTLLTAIRKVRAGAYEHRTHISGRDEIAQIGAEFKKRFADKNINKILTIEASGIGIACIVAKHFHVPVVFAKKTQSINLEGEMYVAEVESFTHKCKNQVIVAKKFLSEEDHVLIIDDFLANGCALQGLIQLVTEAGATVEGIGIVIEKGFQSGGRIIRNLGYPLESLAIVEAMDSETGEITFREQ